MKTRLTKDQWKELIDKVNSKELTVTEGSKIFKVSRMQIYRKLKEQPSIISIHREVRKEEQERIIKREINMECLGCGKSLHWEIMNKKIHIHLCKDCRLTQLIVMSDKIKGEKRLKEKKSITKQIKSIADRFNANEVVLRSNNKTLIRYRKYEK